MILYFSINPDPVHLIKGQLILFWLLTISGLLIIAACLYQNIRYKFRWGNIAGILGGLIFILIAYNINWTYFYSLTIKNRQILLQYYFPNRIEEFPISEIKSYNRRYFGKGSLFYFIIETRGGKVYTSSAMHVAELNENEMKLKKYMETALGYKRVKK